MRKERLNGGKDCCKAEMYWVVKNTMTDYLRTKGHIARAPVEQ